MFSIADYRNFLKVDILEEFDALITDQDKGEPLPPMEKPFPVFRFIHTVALKRLLWFVKVWWTIPIQWEEPVATDMVMCSG